VCIEWGVGTVDWDEFLSTLIAYGNTNEDDIRAAGINENMFGRDYITLTLRDHRGSVVGFDRRFVRYDSTEEAKAKIASRYYPPKFSRTPDSIGIMPDIFLYGVDKVKDFWRRVDIVEGYFDVLSGYQAGHKRIIAACGTSTLEDEHFDLLAKAGARQVGIIMDSDPAGEAATEKIIAKFSNRSDLRMSVVQLDFDENDDPKDRDPDTFFQLYGIDEFNKKKVVSSFSFQLTMQQKRGAKGIDLIRAVIPQLAAEPDAILRGLQIKDLSAKTGIHEDDIRDEVKRLLSGQAQKLANETTKALERVKTPDDVRAVVNNAMERISRLDTSKRSLIGRSAALMNFGASVDKFQAPGGALAGARTGFKLIDDYLGGFPKNGFCVIGGTPNSGKTALANNLIYGMLENISPDHTLLIHSLDDNYAYAFAKLVSIRIRMPIGHCACPEAYIYKVPELTKKYDEALTWLRGLVEDGHLYIFGAESGMNMDTIKRSVGLAQDETGRHVTLVVDSFHNIIGPPGEEERSRYESVSKSLHHMAATGTSVIVTAECNKTAQGQKPRMKDLSETRALSYDANLILVPYNELNEKREDAANYWVGKTSMGNQWVKKPVIELEVEKNKITDFKGTFYYRFIDYECRFEEIPDIKAFMGLQNQEWINHQSGRDGMMPPTIVGDTSAVQTRRQSVLESISHDSRETVSPTFG
jgi:replicative DNA helicase/5S rRNA maturation endonuclease (ribonuclease M5)